MLQMKSQLESLNWQSAFEQKSQEDHEEVMLYLADIANNAALIRSTQEAQAEESRKMMAMMQMVSVYP